MIPPFAPDATAFRRFMPQPICSSQAHGWRGFCVEVYRLGDVELVGTHAEHLVSIQLSDGALLYQRRNGRHSERRVRRGDVIVTPAGEPKTWRRHGGGELLLVSLAPDFLDGVMQQATGRAQARAMPEDNFGARDPEIESLGAALLREVRAPQLGSRMFAEAAIGQLALVLLRRYAAPGLPHPPALSMPPHKLRLAQDYVEEHLAEDLGVEALAATVGMSPFHFAHAFRTATGVPPHKYVMARRMERAKSLLLATRLPLVEIAQHVGYSSQSHFCVGFRRQAGVSPSGFRKGA